MQKRNGRRTFFRNYEEILDGFVFEHFPDKQADIKPINFIRPGNGGNFHSVVIQ